MKALSGKRLPALSFVILLLISCGKRGDVAQVSPAPPPSMEKIKPGRTSSNANSAQKEVALKKALVELEGLEALGGADLELFAELKAEFEEEVSFLWGDTATGEEKTGNRASTPSQMKRLPLRPPTAGPDKEMELVGYWSFLYWKEPRAGDWNNDGIVSAVDVSPIADYWGSSTDYRSPEFLEDAKYIDGNGDGIVNAGDIIPIAVHFGESIAGFSIYEADNEFGSGRRKVAIIGRGSARGLLTLEYDSSWGQALPESWTPTEGKWYQVVPFDQSDPPQESDSLISKWVQSPPNPHYLTARPGYLTWKEAREGDWDNNGAVTPTDMTPLAFHVGATTDPSDPNYWEYAQYIDGNRNGIIDEGDWAQIIHYFSESTEGYNIYEALDQTELSSSKVATVLRPSPPPDPDNPPWNISFATLIYDTSTGDIYPRGWVPTPGRWYQVIPFDWEGDSTRRYSNWVQYQ